VAEQTRRAYLAHPRLRHMRPAGAQGRARAGRVLEQPLPYEDQPFPHRYFEGTVYLNLTSILRVSRERVGRIVLELQR